MEREQYSKLKTWVQRNVMGGSALEPCERIEIYHIGGSGKKGNQISTIAIDADTDIDELITKIETDCICDAEALGAFQRYALFAYFNGRKEPSTRLVIKFSVGDSDDSLDSEPPTKEGLTRHLMRHNESMMKVTAGATGNIIAMQNKTILMLQEQNEALHKALQRSQSKSLELVELVENLQTQKHEREIMTYQAETKAQMTRELGQKAMLMLPAVVNKFVGKKALKEPTTPEAMMLREFVKSFSPEQLETISGALRPEQAMVFNGMVEGLLKQEMEEEEKRNTSEKYSNGPNNSEDGGN